MKKSVKNFVASALAGTISLTSAFSAFAAGKTLEAYDVGETRQVIVGFMHGDSGDNFNAGYDFVQSGLAADTTGTIRAANFVQLDLIKKGESTTNNAAGATTTAQVAYCLAPDHGISPSVYATSSEGYSVKMTDDLSEAAGIHLTDEKKRDLRLALTYGYKGEVNLKWTTNALHGGQYEWMESSPAPLMYSLPDGKYASATSHRIATQICVWMIVTGWFYNTSSETKALDIFVSKLPSKYAGEVREIYSRIAAHVRSGDTGLTSSETYDKIISFLDGNYLEDYMNSSENYTFTFEDGYKVYRLKLPSYISAAFPSIAGDVSSALKKKGMSASDFKVTFKNDLLTIKSKESLDDVEIPLTIGADSDGGLYERCRFPAGYYCTDKTFV